MSEGALVELKTQMNDLQNQNYKHAKHVNETLEKEVLRMEKITSAIEVHTLGGIQELKQQYSTIDDKLEKWKGSFEDTESKKL